VQRDYDVVIAGAGLVGAALGIGLAQAGLRVAVCERGAAPTGLAPDPRGLALNLRSTEILDTLGVWQRLAPQACPVRHIHVTQQGHFGALRLSHEDLHLPVLGHVCPADRLQAVILERLMTSPRVQLFWNTEIRASHACDDYAHVTLRAAKASASAADEEGKLSLTAAMLVGADGTESTLRAQCGITATRHDYGQTAIVCNVDVARPAPETAFERFTTEGPMALLPLGGRRYVMVRAARAAQVPALMALSDADYLADAQQRFGYRLGALSHAGARRAWPLLGLRAARRVAGRCLLLGNAATTVHPNGAQGLNLGLRDVAEAIALLGSAVSRGADPGDERLLARFADARDGDHARIYRLTDAMARGFSLELPAAAAARSLGLLMADRVPMFKRQALHTLVLGGKSSPLSAAGTPA
jgi:2-octaprenyl-6-methoxyphenol hydroxylase